MTKSTNHQEKMYSSNKFWLAIEITRLFFTSKKLYVSWMDETKYTKRILKIRCKNATVVLLTPVEKKLGFT